MRSPSEAISGITRRRLAALLGAAPLAAQVTPPVTQKTPPVGSPLPAPAAATLEAKRQKANDGIRDVSARLAKLEVPMETEPAFVFKP